MCMYVYAYVCMCIRMYVCKLTTHRSRLRMCTHVCMNTHVTMNDMHFARILKGKLHQSLQNVVCARNEALRNMWHRTYATARHTHMRQNRSQARYNNNTPVLLIHPFVIQFIFLICGDHLLGRVCTHIAQRQAACVSNRCNKACNSTESKKDSHTKDKEYNRISPSPLSLPIVHTAMEAVTAGICAAHIRCISWL
jgi:hypothetical protein